MSTVSDFKLPSVEEVELALGEPTLPSPEDIERRLNLPSPEEVERALAVPEPPRQPRRSAHAQDPLVDYIMQPPPNPQDARREELLNERMAQLAEQNQPSVDKLLTRAGLAIGQAGGELERMAGGVMTSPLVARNRRESGRRMLARGSQRSAEYQRLGREVGGGPAGDVAQPLASTALTTLPQIASGFLGGFPASVTAIAAQSFGSGYADARQAYLAQGLKQEEAERKAFAPAVASGVSTALITSLFGPTGIEGLTLKQLNAAGIRTIADSLAKVASGAIREGSEEFSDQVSQNLIARWSYNPDLSLPEALENSIMAGAAGLVIGTGANVTFETAGKAAKKASNLYAEFKEDKDFEQRSQAAALRTATLLSDPAFASDPKFNRIRQTVEKQLVNQGTTDASLRQPLPAPLDVQEQAQTREGVGQQIQVEQQPAGTPAPQETPVQIQTPTGQGQPVEAPQPTSPPSAPPTATDELITQLETHIATAATPELKAVLQQNLDIVRNSVARQAAAPPTEVTTPIEAQEPLARSDPLHGVPMAAEARYMADIPPLVLEKRKHYIDAAERDKINLTQMLPVEFAIAKIDGKYSLAATQEAIRHSRHGLGAIEYLQGVATSDDPTAKAVIARAQQILKVLPRDGATRPVLERGREPTKYDDLLVDKATPTKWGFESNAKDFLNAVVSKSHVPELQDVAKLLITMKVSSRIVAFRSHEDALAFYAERGGVANNLQQALGWYEGATDTVYMNGLERQPRLESTLVHELVHAGSVHVLESDTEFWEDVQSFVYTAEAGYDSDEFFNRVFYGTKDVYEFIAEIFTNVEFRKFLDEIKVPKNYPRGGHSNKMVSLLDRAVEVIQPRLSAPSGKAKAAAPMVETQVMGGQHFVRSREQLTPESKEESIAFTGQVLSELGITAELRQETDARRGNMQISWWRFTGTNQSEQGRLLVERLRQEIATQNEPGKSAELLANLINSIRLNFERGMERVFDRPVREQLYSVAQGEASHRGAMLGALAGHSVDLSFVARNVDVILHREFYEAYGGEGIEALVRRTEQLQRADPEQATNPKAARKRALKTAREELTRDPKTRDKLSSEKKVWRKIEELVKDGEMDVGTIIREIAKLKKRNVPTDGEVAKMKALTARLESLQELTDEEKLEAHKFDDEEETRREKAAKNEPEIVAIRKELMARWSRLKEPLAFWPLSSFIENRQNISRAGAQFAAANILARISFFPRQIISVGTQAFFNLPNRAIAHALNLRTDAIRKGDPASLKALWSDIGDALKKSVKAQAQAVRPAILNARAAFRGRKEGRDVDRLMDGINALERVELKAQEYKANGDTIRYALTWLYAQQKIGYRIAMGVDYLQGTPIKSQELVLLANDELKRVGKNKAERDQQIAYVIGDSKLELLHAAAVIRAETDGQNLSEAQIKQKAAALIAVWQLQRIREIGLPADAFNELAEHLRSTNAWNEMETRGPGGLVTLAGKGSQALFGYFGIPLNLALFANAIGTSINRGLHHTALYKLTNVPIPFTAKAPSPWWHDAIDEQHRKVEAIEGTIFQSIAMGLVFAGAAVVQLRPPLDKEDRELWEREGHKSGTVEFQLGNGQFFPVSLSTSPLTPLAPGFAAAGALMQLFADRAKAQERLNKEAAKKGVPAGEIRGISVVDLMGVAANAAYASLITSSRTASGLVGSLTDYGQLPNTEKFIASQISPLIPGLPAFQEIQRMRGIVLDQKLASIWDFMVPLESSGARKLNLLGEPVGTPDAVQRVVQVLTGGSYGPIDPKANSTPAYEALFTSGYRPPTISPNKGYNIGGTFRPMTDEELVKYTKERGNRLREGLIPLGATADIEAVRDVYSRANAGALRSIGARVETSDSTLNLPARSSLQGVGLGGATLGSSRIGGRSSARFRTRTSRLRRGRRPRLARGRLRTGRLRRGRGIRRLSRGLRL